MSYVVNTDCMYISHNNCACSFHDTHIMHVYVHACGKTIQLQLYYMYVLHATNTCKIYWMSVAFFKHSSAF